MTDLRKAAEMALKALENVYGKGKLCDDAIKALRQALARPEQEPVVWEKSYDIVCALLRQAHDILATTQYPIKRPWVGLTEEEIEVIAKRLMDDKTYCSLHFAVAIQAKLKEKNNAR